MSEHDHDFPATSGSQVVVAILGALIAPTLVIILIVKLLMGVEATHMADTDPAIAASKIEERIKPVASVDVAVVEAGPHVDKSGEAVVTAVCAACHSSGALVSPKIGDKAAWGPRIAQGYETLIKHAIEGIRSMPARGGNAELTDNEVANAIAYMANQSGAKFKAPESGGTSTAAPVAAPAATAVASKPAEADKKSTKSPKAVVIEEKAPAQKSDGVVAQVAATAPQPAAGTAKSAATGKSGEEVVKGVCAMCHSAGLMGAPKIGDKDAWAPRIALGYDTLVLHATKGIRMMPAKGGNPGLSDDEVARAVANMANLSGASFKAP
jgi:cytochrome c5